MKVEFTKRALPTNEKELGDFVAGLQRDAEGVLQEQAGDLTDILYHQHRETIASPPPDPEVVGLG